MRTAVPGRFFMRSGAVLGLEPDPAFLVNDRLFWRALLPGLRPAPTRRPLLSCDDGAVLALLPFSWDLPSTGSLWDGIIVPPDLE